MICEKCKKNTATIHYKQNINGESREIYLCPQCAREEGIMMGNIFQMFNTPYKSTQKATCPTCKQSLDFYRKTGRFSCPDCYSAFSDSAEGIFRKLHKSTSHKGDMTPVPSKIEKLKTELREAIESENFERAAQLRDEIRAMEGGEGK